MKTTLTSTTILFLMLFLSSFKSIGQSEPKFVYCQIIATGRMMSNKVTVELDFGQRMKVFADNRLKDREGNTIKFNTNIDAMNFLGRQGWEVIQSYVVVSQNSAPVYYTIMQKPFKELDEEAQKEYLTSKSDAE